MFMNLNYCLQAIILTAWKVSEQGDFSGPYFTVFGRTKDIYSEYRIYSEYSVRIQENAGHKKFRNWTFFTQWVKQAKLKWMCMKAFTWIKLSDLTEDPDISRFYDMKNKKIIGKTNNETKSVPFLLLSLLK